MTPPSDPAQALKWALDHSNEAWWVIGAIIGGIAWTSKRLRDWSRRNSLAANRAQLGSGVARAELNSSPWAAAPSAPPARPPVPSPAAAQAAPASSYTAAAAYAASAYTAQPAYAAPVAAAASHAGPARKLHREMPPAQRAVTPVARSVDVPAAATGAWTLAGAFGDPAHARTAIVIAEVLGRPVGLR